MAGSAGALLKTGLLKYAIPYLIVGLLCLAIGYHWGSGQQSVIREPVTQFLSPRAFRTTIPQFRSVPDVRFIHTERTDTVTRVDTVRVPVEFDYTGLIERRPLTVTRRSVYLTYYEPGTGQMVTESFDVPQKRFWINYGLQASMVPVAWDQLAVGAFSEVRYRRLALTGSVNYLTDEQRILSMVGLRLYL